MSLDPQREKFAMEKLTALRELSRLLSSTGAFTPEACAPYRVPALVAFAASFSPEAPRSQRVASMLLCELVFDGFKEALPLELLGFVVERDDPAVRAWRKAVLDRDGHACVRCDATGGLEAHHVIRWADDPSQRVVLDNGITVCPPCHKKEHRRGH